MTNTNTHRAVIETSGPPRLELIASGPKDFCEDTLAYWLTLYPLTEYETALILGVEK